MRYRNEQTLLPMFTYLNQHEADFVLPAPPSDNRRLGVFAWISKKPQTFGKAMGRKILTGEARKYIKTTRIKLFGDEEKSLIVPPDSWVIMAYQPYFPNRRRRDGGNLKKMLEDALFNEDVRVCTWVMPTIIEKDCDAKVEVWLFSVAVQEVDKCFSFKPLLQF